MIILIITSLVFVGALITTKATNGYNGNLIAFVSGIFLFMELLCLPIANWEYSAEIADFNSVVETIKQSRINSDLEDVALQHKIVEANQWLAKTKYWDSTIFGLWVPDKIKTLESIR